MIKKKKPRKSKKGKVTSTYAEIYESYRLTVIHQKQNELSQSNNTPFPTKLCLQTAA